MASIREIIERVDENKPNAFSEKTKMAWITALDGKIAADVMLMHITEIRQLEYQYPRDMDSEPLVTYPHQDIYELWLGARIDFENGEYNKYQNTMAMYNQAWNNFTNWFVSVYDPAQGYIRRDECETVEGG